MQNIKERLLELLGLEPLVLLVLLAFAAYLFYKIALRNLIFDRHATLNRLFKELLQIFCVLITFWAGQFFLAMEPEYTRIFNYVGVLTVLTGSVFFVRIVKVLVFEYLFFNNKKVGVPLLLVNLVTIMLSIFIAVWLSTSVFGVRWAPLLATSAIASVVLGLALQDTLGNLFAGVALQFDKPYELGDWIEVHGSDSSQIFAGVVEEITWRATVLHGFYDEVITLPNRMVSQSEISNFSPKGKAIFRGASIYMDVNAPDEVVKAVFLDVLKRTDGVIQHLEHLVMLRDLTEKGAHWRLFYPVINYGKQFVILDQILMLAQTEFKKRGIQVARIRGDILHEP